MGGVADPCSLLDMFINFSFLSAADKVFCFNRAWKKRRGNRLSADNRLKGICKVISLHLQMAKHLGIFLLN